MKLTGWFLAFVFFLVCFNVYRILTTPAENYPNKKPKVVYDCDRALYDKNVPDDVKKECKKNPSSQATR